ncbi:hypothetical protein JX265_004300 [Neoarthrinium moseri]|uniref:Aflatoxin regulatory protein domain-containing protein n=1 Tax=Neoarthrinium moseri TaxID=1658444 RepID=A0A9P9WQN9_9PEZI|nr:hypothetical protein JX265_004300 [Neoarthrinium moseri]
MQANNNQENPELNHIVEDKSMSFAQHVPPSDHLFRVETGWTTPPSSVGDSISRNPSISTGLALLGVDDRTMSENHMPAPPEMFATTIPWTPPNDPSCTPYGDAVSASPMPGSHMRSQSFDLSMSTPMVWTDPTGPDMPAYSQMPTPASMASNYFPSPTATPMVRPAASRNKSSPSIHAGSCNCFTVCLQSLQALHNASSPAVPPFDLVLSLNRKAVEGCAAMLACTKCMSRSGTHTAAMLLATVMGKITSFYKHATHSHFEHDPIGMSQINPGGALGVSFGAYQLNGEDGRWLELEILARELRKLEELYARFREVCADLSDDPEVSRAMIGYLGQNLGTTLEVVSHRKGDMVFA